MSVGEELLELGAQGDERGLKHAYARLLRSNRPDDDADAFQDLHACYQHALAMCRGGVDAERDDPAHDSGSVPADLSPARTPRLAVCEPASPAPDPHAAAEEIVQHAAVHSSASLTELLQDRALGWSLYFRAEVGWALLERLQQESPPLSEAHFAALMQAFGWDDIALNLGPLWLAAIAQRCWQAWQLLPGSRAALRIGYERCSDRYLSAQETDEAVARLRDPRPRWRNRLDALAPNRARDTPFLLAALKYWPDEVVPPGLDAGQVGFWARFGDDAHHVRLHYSAVRCAILGVFLGLVTAWGVYSSPAVGTYKGMAIIAVATVLVPAAWLLGWGSRAVLRWQCAEEGDARGPAWLRWAFLPVAAAAVGAMMWAQRAWGVDGLLLMVLDRAWVFGLTLVAITRARVRGPEPQGEANGLPLVVGVVLPVAGILIALVYWAVDLRRTRAMRWRTT